MVDPNHAQRTSSQSIEYTTPGSGVKQNISQVNRPQGEFITAEQAVKFAGVRVKSIEVHLSKMLPRIITEDGRDCYVLKMRMVKFGCTTHKCRKALHVSEKPFAVASQYRDIDISDS